MQGRVLTIAGSDPSGGAGVQADIKTVTALGGYAAAAITALTVQNTKGVTGVHPVAPDVIRAQIIAVLEDIGADAIKIGMIGERAAGVAIADALVEFAATIPVILDPVLVATSGDALAGDDMPALLLERLVPIAAVVTPNAEEAAVLAGFDVASSLELVAAGQALIRRGATAALVKGGHLDGDDIEDALVTLDGARLFRHPRIETTSTHGTGCALASAVATGLAQGAPLAAAVKRAIDYVHEAIKTAPGFGQGAGPLNHAWPLERD
ncbi:MAG TPA: bifunctional hydroxymethylpyrimidine kinase/phosphomethylpyrimidine kinase [Parvularculaceae bacterium]|nr:bifunctional hydroxymethylpyrimidine kinase/phosphomethylpyrimidine kinase [Parvularculaceae bacterium]